MGLRTGTPDAEATITTRSARLDLDSRVGGRRSSSGDRRPSFRSLRASAIDAPFARARHPLVAAVPNPARQTRRACPAAKPSAAPGTPPPRGGARPPAPPSPARVQPRTRSPPAGPPPAPPPRSPTGRARAPAVRRGRRRRAPARAPRSPPVTRSASSASRAVPRTGRPGSWLGREIGRRRARAAGPAPAAGRCATTPSSRPVASATRTAPASTGSVTHVVDRASAGASDAPSSAADARAARSAASAADAGHPRAVHRVVVQRDDRVPGPSHGLLDARAAPPAGPADHRAHRGMLPPVEGSSPLPGLTVRVRPCATSVEPQRSAAPWRPGRGGREAWPTRDPPFPICPPRAAVSRRVRSSPRRRTPPRTYERAEADREAFWAEQANRLTWATPFDTVLDWSTPRTRSGSPTGS